MSDNARGRLDGPPGRGPTKGQDQYTACFFPQRSAEEVVAQGVMERSYHLREHKFYAG